MNKKKLHFYQLSFVFGSLIIVTLILLWGSSDPNMETSGMMSGSMSSMMAGMHAKGATIGDLFSKEEKVEMSTENHIDHHGSNSGVQQIHRITTIIIILLLPLIIAGSIFLAIVWI